MQSIFSFVSLGYRFGENPGIRHSLRRDDEKKVLAIIGCVMKFTISFTTTYRTKVWTRTEV